MKRWLFIAGLSLGTTALAAGLSFDEARAVLQSRSDALLAAHAETGQRQMEAKAAETLGYPEVSLDYVQIEGKKAVDLGTFPILGHVATEYDLGGPRSRVTMNWPIFTGGKITAVQQAKAADAQAAQEDQRNTEGRLDSELAQRYFGLRLASNIERLRQALFEQSERDYQRALRFEKQGQISALERLSSQVARDEAEREHVKAASTLATAKAALARLLRSDVVDATSPLFMHSRPIPPLDEWLQLARNANPMLAMLHAKHQAAEQGVDAARAAYYPEVFAYGEYNVIKRNLSLTEPDWIAGIGVRVKLLSREDRGSSVSAARLQAEKVNSLRDETLNKVETAVETYWLQATQAQQQYTLFTSSLTMARENLRLRQRAFEEGQSTVLEVNDARNALLRAETEQSRIAYEFDVTLVALLEMCGQSARYSDYIKTADVTLMP